MIVGVYIHYPFNHLYIKREICSLKQKEYTVIESWNKHVFVIPLADFCI